MNTAGIEHETPRRGETGDVVVDLLTGAIAPDQVPAHELRDSLSELWTNSDYCAGVALLVAQALNDAAVAKSLLTECRRSSKLFMDSDLLWTIAGDPSRDAEVRSDAAAWLRMLAIRARLQIEQSLPDVDVETSDVANLMPSILKKLPRGVCGHIRTAIENGVAAIQGLIPEPSVAQLAVNSESAQGVEAIALKPDPSDALVDVHVVRSGDSLEIRVPTSRNFEATDLVVVTEVAVLVPEEAAPVEGFTVARFDVDELIDRSDSDPAQVPFSLVRRMTLLRTLENLELDDDERRAIRNALGET